MKKNNKKQLNGIKQGYGIKIRQELNDQDYIHKLSEEEKKWLNDFNMEYIHANFGEGKKRIHPKKMVTKKNMTNKKNRKVDLYKSERDAQNYKRKKDAFLKSKVMGKLVYPDEKELAKWDKDNVSPEDALITIMDYKEMIKKS